MDIVPVCLIDCEADTAGRRTMVFTRPSDTRKVLEPHVGIVGGVLERTFVVLDKSMYEVSFTPTPSQAEDFDDQILFIRRQTRIDVAAVCQCPDGDNVCVLGTARDSSSMDTFKLHVFRGSRIDRGSPHQILETMIHNMPGIRLSMCVDGITGDVFVQTFGTVTKFERTSSSSSSSSSSSEGFALDRTFRVLHEDVWDLKQEMKAEGKSYWYECGITRASHGMKLCSERKEIWIPKPWTILDDTYYDDRKLDKTKHCFVIYNTENMALLRHFMTSVPNPHATGTGAVANNTLYGFELLSRSVVLILNNRLARTFDRRTCAQLRHISMDADIPATVSSKFFLTAHNRLIHYNPPNKLVVHQLLNTSAQFLLGFHKRCGQQSFLYTDIATSPLFEPHLIRTILEFAHKRFVSIQRPDAMPSKTLLQERRVNTWLFIAASIGLGAFVIALVLMVYIYASMK